MVRAAFEFFEKNKSSFFFNVDAAVLFTVKIWNYLFFEITHTIKKQFSYTTKTLIMPTVVSKMDEAAGVHLFSSI